MERFVEGSSEFEGVSWIDKEVVGMITTLVIPRDGFGVRLSLDNFVLLKLVKWFNGNKLYTVSPLHGARSIIKLPVDFSSETTYNAH